MRFLNGVVSFESNDQYHRREEISCSMVKNYLKSPEDFEWYNIKGNRKDSTGAMDFGTAVHEDHLLAIWEQSWLEIPKESLTSNGARRGKAWDEFKAANPGKILLKSEQLESIKIIRDQIAAHPLAMDLLKDRENALTELSITADCPLPDGSTQKVRGRIDWLSPGFILDFKTISDLERRTIEYRPHDHHWSEQAVMYQLLINAVRGGDLLPVYFVVCETQAPYRVEVFQPRHETLVKASARLQGSIEAIVERTRSGNWHRDGWPNILEF